MFKRITALAAVILLGCSHTANAQTETVSYTYDALGRVTSMTSSVTTATYSYDAAGNRTQLTTSHVNRPPVANTDSVTVNYGVAATFDPKTNDTDPDGDALTIASVGAPSHGAVTNNAGASLTYTPAAGFYGADALTYSLSDGKGGTATGTVNITVATPSAPTVAPVSVVTPYNSAKAIALTPSGIYTALSVAAGPSHGTATISGLTATYTPTNSFYGADSFTYTATGPGGTSAAASVTVTVAQPPLPTVGAVSATVSYNTAQTVNLAPSGVYSAMSVATGPSHGSASISGATATYTPTSGYVGADSFTYTATGPSGVSTPATVTLTVSAPTAPTVANTSLSAAYNGAGAVALPVGGLYTSIGFPGGSPTHGTLGLSGATVTYFAAAGYYGADSFTYNATGPGGVSPTATVSVTVANPPAPTVANTSLSAAYNGTGAVALPVGGVYSSIGFPGGSPAHGTLGLSGNTVTYVAATGYYGPDSFTYNATGPGGVSPTATVSVTVANPPAPTVANASLSAAYIGTGAVALPVGGVYTSIGFPGGSPAHGTLGLSGATVTYVAAAGYYGADSFTYNATGPGGVSPTATVTVTVANPPAPTAAPLAATTLLNTAVAFSLAPAGVYSGLALAVGPSHGSVTISGTTATYTPSAGYSGSDSFTYVASGPGGTSAAAAVSLSVLIPGGTVLFTSNTPGAWSYTLLAGVAAVDVEIWGGGGGAASILFDGPAGKGGNGNVPGGGGGGGGYAKKHISAPSGAYTGAVGAGGVAAPATPKNIAGGAGGASTVTTLGMTANGGTSGGVYALSPGGTATGGDVNISGNQGIVTPSHGGGAGNGGGDGDATLPGGGGAGSLTGGSSGANGRVVITARAS